MHGREEGRGFAPHQPRWALRQILEPQRQVAGAAQELKIAACLHIFYEDYIHRFAQALNEFPIELDVLLTLAKEEHIATARKVFEAHPRGRHVEIRVVPNRGRNFAPWLVEYAEKLQQYDLFCHLHSKKSLYSGREQTQWADYATEFTLRKRAQFKGDVSIIDIYTELVKQLGATDQEGQCWMQQEFELDLRMIQAKNEMVELFNTLGSLGHKLWVISDTYYTRGQVGLMLKKAGVTVPYRLLVSSAEQKRKDNGTMWHMVKQDLEGEGITRHLHIGDNVVADAQLPGDLGLTTFHILHPMDKWQALGFPEVLQGDDALDEGQILKWGKLVSAYSKLIAHSVP
ncbi:rhamnan synthesis F family protein [Vreelandella aquamarina]|nr:rhamnan synthesis F family protein [Halomonas aquamarina]